MFKPRITVSIELEPGRTVAVQRTLSEMIVYDTFQALDHPSPGADSFTAAMFCTDTATVARVMKSRKDISKLLSRELTEALLDQMGAKDTEMGYEKHSRKEATK